jgi:hypothetical protein
MLQPTVLRDRHTVSHRKVEKSVLLMKGSLWNNHRNFVKDLPMVYKFHCNCNYSL